MGSGESSATYRERMAAGRDERIAELYGLPLPDFTPARNVLAASLRKEGDNEAAAAVKALRKPSAAAWAVNQLVRAEPDLVEALLGAGGELRQAHRQAASGKRAEQLRAAANAERAAVDALLARAPAALGHAPSPALAEAMRNTLHAASSDDEARELVASGTLTTELRPVGLGPVPGGSAGHGSAADVAQRAASEAERVRELRAAKTTEKELGRKLDAAHRAVVRSEDAYARAREAADIAEARLRETRQRLRDARARFTEAQRRRSRLDTD